MLDIHTHILPEMDDGSKSLRQSLAMLRKEAKQGADRVVLTPHYYANKEAPERFVARRMEAYKILEEAAEGKDALPQRYLGAEVAYFNGMSRTDETDLLCIGDTRSMLIEMPFGRWSQHVLDEIDFLKERRGILPIIAHVERYMHYQPLGTIRHMCEAGICFQVNATFFQHWQTAWLAMHMLKNGQIHFIGSDCHDTKYRPPNMGLALSEIERRLGRSAINYLERMESMLLEGE